jgi:hypothetical protein
MDIYVIGAMRRTKLMIGGRILALAIQFTLARDAAGQQATSQLVPLLDRQSEIALVTSAYLRDECLNETLFTSLAHAREVLSIWKDDYNTVRPHSGLGNLSPAAYAKRSDPRTQRDGALRYTEGSAPHPVASPSQQGSNQPGTPLIAGGKSGLRSRPSSQVRMCPRHQRRVHAAGSRLQLLYDPRSWLAVHKIRRLKSERK